MPIMKPCPKHPENGVIDLEEGCPLCIAARQEDKPIVAFAADDPPRITSEGLKLINSELEIGQGLAKAAQEAGAEVTVVEMAMETKPETSIVLRPGEDLEVHDYFEQAVIILGYAERRTITTLDDNKAANDYLTIISRHKKKMEAKKRAYLDPLKEQADAIRETYSTLMDPIIAAEKITKDKMLAYNAEQKRIREEQEKVNTLRLEAAQRDAALHNGEISESVNLITEMHPAPKKVSTDMGTSSQKDNWKWEVTKFSLVPDEFKIINPAIMTPTAKSYKDKRTIPGIRIFNAPILATRVG